jgi:hypothetical protein
MKVQTWHRRHAILLAAQLPEDHDDALAVLCAAIDLVQGFLAGDEAKPVKKPSLTVVPIGGNECA